MNLHNTVAAAIGSVNPFISMTVTRNTGYTTAADGKRTPTTSTTTVSGQWQNLNAKELEHLNAMNIQGDLGAIYVNGSYDGVVRADGTGGDLFTFNGKNWLVVQVMEQWPDWCKVVVCLQR